MEYVLALRMKRRKVKVHKPLTTYLAISEEECLLSLHLPRDVVTEICHLVSEELSSKSTFPLAVRVVSALHFLATGSIQCSIKGAEGIASGTVIAFIAAFSQELVRHAPEFVVFPSTAMGQAQVRKEFKDKFGAVDVLGVIDCTHVVMRAPEENNRAYFNNEGSYSINVQIVCDASNKITHVSPQFPARNTDSSILEKSELHSIFAKDPPPVGHLLGDSAYPLKTWLMTPFGSPKTKPELSFNIMHIDAFEAMNRTVGMLKKRFQCLDKSIVPLKYGPKKIGLFFEACCVLHNIALRHGCQMELDESTITGLRRLDNAMHTALPEAETDSAAVMRRAQLALALCDK